MYTIEKVLNSNIVLGQDEKRQKFILLGKGIGYGKKSGMIIEQQSVEQTFIPVDNSEVKKIKDLLLAISPETIEVTQDIVKYAKDTLQVKFKDSIYFLLADHINFAIKRYIEDIRITNRIFWEIKNFYSKEFAVGLYAIQVINERFHINLGEEEAANIAFHLVNALDEKEDSIDSMKAAKLVGVIVNIVRYSIQEQFDTESIHYVRFITHIKYFVERFFANKLLNEADDILYDQVSSKYKNAFSCALKIDDYFYDNYKIHLPHEELTYLIVHTQRLISKG